MTFTTRIFLILLVTWAALPPTAFAGPLRDRIAQRMQERQAEGRTGTGPLGDMNDMESQGTGTARFDLPAGARLLADVPYGSDKLQRMDIYLPAPGVSQGRLSPLIFMVHGGAWRTGDKAGRGVAQNKVARWVAKGFVFVSVNYRLLPQADPLAQADDVARALAAVQKAASGWGGDAARVVLLGHSAGAHLVALLNAAPSRALALGARPWLGAVALDSAVLDVTPVMQARHLPFYDKAFGGDPDFWRAASPLQLMQAGAPPLLAVCSSSRKDQPCRAAERMAAQAGPLGLRVQVLPQDKNHGEINSQLGLPGPYTDAVESFMGSLDPEVRALLAAR